MPINTIIICAFIGLVTYKCIKRMYCYMRKKIQQRKCQNTRRSEWLKGFYFAEEEIKSHPFGFVTVEDILHEVACENNGHEEYYVGMMDYLTHYYNIKK